MSRVVRFEIHATDPGSLATFYESLFGWTFQKWDGPLDFWTIRTGTTEEPGIEGGLIRRPCEAPVASPAVNAFICTVDVASAEASLARAVELGGVVALPLMPVPGMGWLCYAKDLDGNIFGMMQIDPAAA